MEAALPQRNTANGKSYITCGKVMRNLSLSTILQEICSSPFHTQSQIFLGSSRGGIYPSPRGMFQINCCIFLKNSSGQKERKAELVITQAQQLPSQEGQAH